MKKHPARSALTAPVTMRAGCVGRRTFMAAGVAAAATLACGNPSRGGTPRDQPASPSPPARRMNTRPIPRSGEALPCVGLGTWQSFDVGPDAYPSRSAVLDALFEAGGSVIDSSPMYGRSEAVVGKLLTAGRHAERAFRATKVWTDGAAAGVEQMRSSLHKMGAPAARPFGLMQVHNLRDVEAHLPTLRAWKAEGRLRYIGVTHYLSSAFDQLERLVVTGALDFVQLPYSVAAPQAEQRLLPAAKDTGTAVLVNRPFDGGSLFGRVKGRPLPDWARETGAASWAQVFLKWILGHDAVTCPIPGTGKARHMRDNARAGFGPLPDAALRRRMERDIMK